MKPNRTTASRGSTAGSELPITNDQLPNCRQSTVDRQSIDDAISPNKRGRAVDITQRTADFADRVIRLTVALPNNCAAWEIGRQLVRCGMSIGANVDEAQGAESKPDFVHKMKIARKECREAKYFMHRVMNAKSVTQMRLSALLDEVDQIQRVLTTIILRTCDKNDRPR